MATFAPVLFMPTISSVQAFALHLFGTVCQNNIKCQEYILNSGFLPKFLQLLSPDQRFEVRVKALFATSCKCFATTFLSSPFLVTSFTGSLQATHQHGLVSLFLHIVMTLPLLVLF